MRNDKGIWLEETKIYPVYRLDKETSGLIIYALNAEAHKILNDDFQNRKIEKIYHAVSAGIPHEENFKTEAKLRIDGDKLHRQRDRKSVGRERV